jgi:hypothetical protein
MPADAYVALARHHVISGGDVWFLGTAFRTDDAGRYVYGKGLTYFIPFGTSRTIIRVSDSKEPRPPERSG